MIKPASSSTVLTQIRHLQDQLVKLARGGDTEPLILYLYDRLQPTAKSLCMSANGVHLDYQELQQEAILHILKRLPDALATDHPVALLMLAGKGRMLRFARENRTCLRIPGSSQKYLQNKGVLLPQVYSLDEEGQDGSSAGWKHDRVEVRV